MKITFIVFEDVDEVPEVVAEALLRATSPRNAAVTPGDDLVTPRDAGVTAEPQVEDEQERRKSLQRKRQAAYRERRKKSVTVTEGDVTGDALEKKGSDGFPNGSPYPSLTPSLTPKKRVYSLTRTREGEGDFDSFWAVWTRRVGRATAAKAWGRLTSDEQEITLTHVPLYLEAKALAGESVPYPATYLNQQRFLDDELPDGRRLERDDEGRVVRALPRVAADGGVLGVPAPGGVRSRVDGAHGPDGPRQGRRSAREVAELSFAQYLGLDGVEGDFDPGPLGSGCILDGNRGGDPDGGFRFVAPAVEGPGADEREGDRLGVVDPWGD